MMLEHELSRVLAVSVMVALLMEAVKYLFKLDTKSDFYRRLQPTVALALGAGIGAALLPFDLVTDRLSWGAVAGGFSSGGYSIVKSVIDGVQRRAAAGELPNLPPPPAELPDTVDHQDEDRS